MLKETCISVAVPAGILSIHCPHMSAQCLRPCLGRGSGWDASSIYLHVKHRMVQNCEVVLASKDDAKVNPKWYQQACLDISKSKWIINYQHHPASRSEYERSSPHLLQPASVRQAPAVRGVLWGSCEEAKDLDQRLDFGVQKHQNPPRSLTNK